MTHGDEIRRFFTHQVETGTSTPIDEETLARLLEVADPAPGWRVLDAGCGPGVVAVAIAAQVSEVVGIDVTPASLDEARRRARRFGVSNVRFEEADIEQMPFEDGTFDLVLSRRVGHHLRGLDRALAEMARVLAPGRRLIVEDRIVPEDAEVARAVNELELQRDPSHVRCLSISEWRALLANAGFEVERVLTSETDTSWERFLAPVSPERRPELVDRLGELVGAPSGAALVDGRGRTLHQWSALFRAAKR